VGFRFIAIAMAKTHSDIGLIGLAVMGQNLALNIADHGFQISVYNRTTEKTDAFVAENPNTPGGFGGHQDAGAVCPVIGQAAQDDHPGAGR
jgi:predicted dinucleotide-binding enzyme